VIVREPGGNAAPAVFVAALVRACIAKGTTVDADEASAWCHLQTLRRRASTIRRRTASTAPAPIGQKSISAVSVAAKSVFTTSSRGRT